MVVLNGGAATTLRRLAATAYPAEGCGVLVGTVEEGRVSVVEVTSGRNLVRDRSRDRYELDPAAIVLAERRARGAGLDVVGFWHSHPDHPARPSPLDSERAWPDYAYLIVAVAAGVAVDLRAYSLPDSGGELTERGLRIDAAAPAA